MLMNKRAEIVIPRVGSEAVAGLDTLGVEIFALIRARVR